MGKTSGSKSWHVYRPSRVRNLNIGETTDAGMYEMAAQLQKQVSKGVTRPKYTPAEKAKDIV